MDSSDQSVLFNTALLTFQSPTECTLFNYPNMKNDYTPEFAYRLLTSPLPSPIFPWYENLIDKDKNPYLPCPVDYYAYCNETYCAAGLNSYGCSCPVNNCVPIISDFNDVLDNAIAQLQTMDKNYAGFASGKICGSTEKGTSQYSIINNAIKNAIWWLNLIQNLSPTILFAFAELDHALVVNIILDYLNNLIVFEQPNTMLCIDSDTAKANVQNLITDLSNIKFVTNYNLNDKALSIDASQGVNDIILIMAQLIPAFLSIDSVTVIGQNAISKYVGAFNDVMILGIYLVQNYPALSQYGPNNLLTPCEAGLGGGQCGNLPLSNLMQHLNNVVKDFSSQS